MTRFTIDPTSDDLELPQADILLYQDCEFPRIDDRKSMQKYRHCFFDMMNPSLGTDFERIAPVMGGGFPPYNSLGHFDIQTEKLSVYFPGKTHLVQEPVFVPRSATAEEGDGWLMALVNNYATMASELHIIDTKDFSKAQAIVLLPVRLRHGLHGNWVPREDLDRAK